jgi:hypothetical protein
MHLGNGHSILTPVNNGLKIFKDTVDKEHTARYRRQTVELTCACVHHCLSCLRILCLIVGVLYPQPNQRRLGSSWLRRQPAACDWQCCTVTCTASTAIKLASSQSRCSPSESQRLPRPQPRRPRCRHSRSRSRPTLCQRKRQEALDTFTSRRPS